MVEERTDALATKSGSSPPVIKIFQTGHDNCRRDNKEFALGVIAES
jgi:hypothetical protein